MTPAAAILLAASVWRDASRRLDHALAILDDPDQEDTMPDLAPRCCGYRWQHAIGHAGHLDLACDLPAGHYPKLHSAPNPDLPRLYYVDPDVAPEARALATDLIDLVEHHYQAKDGTLPLHRSGTLPTVCGTCDGQGCWDCTDKAGEE